MKLYLSLITAAALSLSACSQESAPAPSAPASTPAVSEVAGASDAAAPVADESCATVVESNDAMQFNTKEIAIKSSCENFTITLKHTGKTPKEAMGHNLVITQASDKEGVLKDGLEAKIENDYLKPNDPRVLAASTMIGGGEETQFVVDTKKLSKDGDYDFFCSFPGHGALMVGKVKLVD